jgi:hypothetical protein
VKLTRWKVKIGLDRLSSDSGRVSGVAADARASCRGFSSALRGVLSLAVRSRPARQVRARNDRDPARRPVVERDRDDPERQAADRR